MLRKTFLLIPLFAATLSAKAQDSTDSVQALNEVVVNSYFSAQPLLTTPASISVLSSKQLQNHAPYSLVSAMNTVPGVRFEERSPGSYRLSIRGSLLRSPFGIRNVKVYYDDFPLTDAGGNTYLNILDAGNANRIEVLKGPEGSIFGANTGGVVNISSGSRMQEGVDAIGSLTGGSYGLFRQNFGLSKTDANNVLTVYQANQKSDGYREQSALKRNSFNIANNWNYSGAGSLKALLLISKINYETPGGLTIEQSRQNARSARQKTNTLPGAVEQRAGVRNATAFAGLANEYVFSKSFRHVVSVFGSHTDFANPFITNYEERDENTAGLRTYLELKKKASEKISISWQTGLETQLTTTQKSNFNNNSGVKGALQRTPVKLRANQSFLFSRLSAESGNWHLEAAGSLNYYQYKFGEYSLPLSQHNKRKLSPQLMPRVALSYQITQDLSWRASAAKGYSSSAGLA